MSTDEIRITEATALKVAPGDRLIVELPENSTPERYERFREHFRAVWPDVEIAFLVGASVVRDR